MISGYSRLDSLPYREVGRAYGYAEDIEAWAYPRPVGYFNTHPTPSLAYNLLRVISGLQGPTPDYIESGLNGAHNSSYGIDHRLYKRSEGRWIRKTLADMIADIARKNIIDLSTPEGLFEARSKVQALYLLEGRMPPDKKGK